MRILITGIGGFLASHLADALLVQGHEVVGVDNFIGGDIENVPKGAKLYVQNCCDDMTSVMEGVDVVYHTACTAHEGLSMFSPHFITRNTFDSTMSVLSAAIEKRVKRFVYLSSMARYGTQEGTFTEDMTPKPQDPYGISKYASELAIKCLCEAHGIEYSIAVPHSIIGTRQKYDDPYRNVAAIFINLMLQGKAPRIYGDGQQTRSFSFVSDVVEPLVKMGTLPEANGQIINLGPDCNDITLLQLYEIIAELTGCTKSPIFVEGRPGEVKHATCSADKARRLLGYESRTTTEESLKEMVEWITERGTKPFQYTLPIEINSPLMPKTWSEKLY